MTTNMEVDAQRRYLCRVIKQLTYDDTIIVFRTLVAQIDKDMVNVHGNGSSINLDDVADKSIQMLYKLVQLKLNDPEDQS